jgi:hypothetical protein
MDGSDGSNFYYFYEVFGNGQNVRKNNGKKLEYSTAAGVP